ncbi:MAG: chemotaxis protein CheW [Planctomycetota bacterium]|jgi:purine-binding chemotaxis protein CheW
MMPGALSKKPARRKGTRAPKSGPAPAEPLPAKADAAPAAPAETTVTAVAAQPVEAPARPKLRPKRAEVGLGSLAETTEHEVQVVTFTLGREEYAIDILQVQEIVMMTEITRMPRAPKFIEGIVNLRGQMIPIIDMRKRFDLAEAEHDSETRIIIVEIAGELVGMVVDGVREVIRLPDSAISPPPPMIQGISAEYLNGIGQIGERLLIMLDLGKILSADEQEVLRKLGPDNCPLVKEQ